MNVLLISRQSHGLFASSNKMRFPLLPSFINLI